MVFCKARTEYHWKFSYYIPQRCIFLGLVNYPPPKGSGFSPMANDRILFNEENALCWLLNRSFLIFVPFRLLALGMYYLQPFVEQKIWRVRTF